MSSSSTHTTSNLARFRAMVEEWEASQPPPQTFPTEFNLTIGDASIETGSPRLQHGADRDGKDVTVAFRTRPPLEGEAKEKFTADPNFLVKNAKSTVPGENVSVEGDDIEFCPGISVRSAEPGVMVAQVPGMKWSGPTISQKSYTADLAFGPDIGNDEVYARTVDAHDMINLVLGGGVGCVLAYGQTGEYSYAFDSSGKTYTMEALEQRISRDIFPAAKALSARLRASHGQGQPVGGTSLADIASLNLAPGLDYDGSKDASSNVFNITVTFVELLGKKATDLLAVAGTKTDGAEEASLHTEAGKEVPIMENRLGEVRPPLLEPSVTSPEELSALITRALSHRRTSATARNARSSRSHALLTLRVKNTLLPYADEGVLILVDLAGTERYEDSKLHDMQRMGESRENNKTLMNLKECVRAKARSAVEEEGFVHIPYRASKLTMLLKPIFDLESRKLSKTIVIAHVSPFIQDAAHSANTLSYAAPFKSSPPRQNGPVAYDASDPRTWDSERTREWLRSAFEEFGRKKARRVMVDVDKMVPNPMTAKNVARLYASEWFDRCLGARVEGNKVNVEDVKDVAMNVYGRFHYLLMKARTKTRKETMKSRKGLVVKDVYGNKPGESDDPAAGTEVAKPHVSAETAADDVDWMILMMLHYHEATTYISAAVDRARADGQPHYLVAREKAVMEMFAKYRDEIEAEKRKVKEEDLRKELEHQTNRA